MPEAQAVDGQWVTRAWPRWPRATACCCSWAACPERVPGDKRVLNTSVLIGPDGATIACYRKIHLFDIDLPGPCTTSRSRAP